MKNNFIYSISNALHCRAFTTALLILALTFANLAYAQEAKVSADQKDKISFKMQLSAIVSNGIRSVKVQIRKKENKKTVPVGDLKSPFNLYLNEVAESNPTNGNGWLSKVHIHSDGIGFFELPSHFNKLTSGLHEFTFIAKMVSDPVYEDSEGEITVADARISLKYNGEDSIKTVTASLSAWRDTDYVPVANAEVKLSIKRTFNSLPFGEDGLSTSDSGEVSGDLPLDIPGNSNGTLTIIARLDEDETYGTVEATADIPWAVLPRVNPVRGRTLWSSGDNAPIPLVISSVTIVIIIWGTIIYLVYLLFRIKRLSKAPLMTKQE